jgi:hypothetical protein
MPLLEINQVRHICASVRLDEVTAAQVDQYAAFIHASADEVVDEALNYGATEQPARKVVAGVESTPSVRAMKV